MYPLDRRIVAIHIYSLLHSLRKIALLVQVSVSTVSRWLKQPQRKTYVRQVPSKSLLIMECIRSAIASNPFVSIRFLQNLIHDTLQLDVSKELIRVAISKLGMSRKKARFFSVPHDLERKTLEFVEARDHFLKKGHQFFSIDETSFGRNIKDVSGYSLRGKQLRIPRAKPHVTTSSSIAIINTDKIVCHKEQNGSFNTSSFLDFLTSCDLPTGSVLLMDNVAFHHAKVIKEYAKTIGIHLLYTPPYSPWFNPIEGVFSIIKRSFYTGKSIQEAYSGVTKQHCAAFMAKSLQWKMNQHDAI